MDDMLELWHLQMPADLELVYLQGVRAFGRLSRAKYPPATGIEAAVIEGIWGSPPMVEVPVMSVCSGCGIAEKGLSRLFRFYR